MNKEFIPYEQALELKELGFNEECMFFYCNHKNVIRIVPSEINIEYFRDKDFITCLAPLYQQAFRWFREKYELFCWIEKFHKDETYIFQIPPANFTKIQGHFNTYEEAELACLKKLIEIIKNK